MGCLGCRRWQFGRTAEAWARRVAAVHALNTFTTPSVCALIECVPLFILTLVSAGMDVKHACYAHLWDASRTRLFVCGGPLAFGLAGCYMAVWH